MAIPLGPLLYGVMRALGRASESLEGIALQSWEHAPAQEVLLPPMILLPGSLEKVVSGPDFGEGTILRDLVVADALRDRAPHGPTRVHEVSRGVLSGGAVFARGGRYALRRSPLISTLRWVSHYCEDATLVSSLAGSNYFGHWILEDCAQQLLAEELGGELVDVARPVWLQELGYRDLLDLCQPSRLDHVRIGTLRIIEDHGSTVSKARRIGVLKKRIADRVQVRGRIPGVFVRRGQSGSRRALINEDEVLEKLVLRGFEVADPEGMSAEAVSELLYRSRVVVGVEGSHMCVNPVAMQRGSCCLELHPANRFYPLQRVFLGPQGIRYGVLVCQNEDVGSFRADLDDLGRLLDMCERAVRS